MTVLGQGIIELSADGSKLNAAIAEARKSIDGLGKSSKQSSEAASRSIDRYIQSLDTQAKLIGKSASEQTLYKLALKGATDEQLRAANSSLVLAQKNRDTEKTISSLRSGFIALGAAAVAALGGAIYMFDKLVKQAGDFQDLAEKIGDTGENIASLAVAAATAGISMGHVAKLSTKLSSGLAGVDDESKSAGAALTALGLNISEFKKLNPTDQIETVAKAMANFEDGASKTAVAMALFGNAGADALPFLKELSQEGSRQKILTEEQIQLADAYADSQAKLSAEIGLYAQAIATDLIPTVNSFTSVLRDIASDQEFAASASSILKGAMNALIVIFQTITVVGSEIAFVFNGVGREIGAIAAQLVSLATLDIDGFTAIGDMVKKDAADARAELDRFQAKIMSIGTESAKIVEKTSEAVNKPKGKLAFTGATKKGEDDKLAKSALDKKLADIKASTDQEISIYANAQKIIDAQKQAWLISEKTYNDSRIKIIFDHARAQETGLKQELEALKSVTLEGSAKDANDQKIIETQSKLNKLYADTATSLDVLAIQLGAMGNDANFADSMSRGIDNFKSKLVNLSQEASSAVESAMGAAVDGIASSISQAIVYGKNLEDSLKGVALNIADAFISAFIKMQIQKMLLDKTTQIAYAATMTSQAQAMVAMSGLNAFSSTAAIPIVGPALAPAAAAAASATAQGFAALVTSAATASIASARGGFDIPAGVNPLTQLHEKEMVLPAAQANVIRDMASNGVSGGGGIIDNTTINIDSRSDRIQVMKDVQRMIENGHSRLVDTLKRQRALA